MKSYDYKKIDNILHSRIRLAVVAILIANGEVDFVTLKKGVQATDGNMNTHLKKLEEHKYISVKKVFLDRKPVTLYSLTKTGIDAFQEYVHTLERFINKN